MTTVGPDPIPDRDPRALLEALLARFETASGSDGPARALLSVASPRFAALAGDASHLAHLFGNAAWSPLLGHATAEVGEIALLDDTARTTIRVRAADGTTVSYLASLRHGNRREGSRDDRREDPREHRPPRWQITGLVRSELSDT